MWRSQKTYLRLLNDVYIGVGQQGTTGLKSDDDAPISSTKLNKLIAYLKQCPKRLTNVCRTLYHNIKKNCHKRMDRCVLKADFLIFQVCCKRAASFGHAIIAISPYHMI